MADRNDEGMGRYRPHKRSPGNTAPRCQGSSTRRAAKEVRPAGLHVTPNNVPFTGEGSSNRSNGPNPPSGSSHRAKKRRRLRYQIAGVAHRSTSHGIDPPGTDSHAGILALFVPWTNQLLITSIDPLYHSSRITTTTAQPNFYHFATNPSDHATGVRRRSCDESTVFMLCDLLPRLEHAARQPA